MTAGFLLDVQARIGGHRPPLQPLGSHISSVFALVIPRVIGAQKKPEVRVAPNRVKPGDPVLLTGTGFTPNRSVLSHLLRPNGSE
jgi:hypothetical protein